MEKRLLLVTDALARRKGLDRSKLIALAIRELIEREAASSSSSAQSGQAPTPAA
jgi:metal-responsive CopG/Arc/MetJ family transcriptional regulator